MPSRPGALFFLSLDTARAVSSREKGSVNSVDEMTFDGEIFTLESTESKVKLDRKGA